MNLKNHALVFFSVLLLGVAVVLSGCATTGMDRFTAAANSIQTVDNEIRRMSFHIDATATSLDHLIKAEPEDLKRSFDIYSDNLTNLEAQGKLVSKRVQQMKSRNKEYFAEWDKQGDSYTNPEIRELSEERRNKLAEMYAQVPIAGAGIENTYQAYLTNLKEIRRYLSNDLTPAGVKAIELITQQTFRGLDSLLGSLKPLIDALDAIKSELYSDKK